VNIRAENEWFEAYRRLDSRLGTVDDFFLCECPIYEKIISAAETNLNKEYSFKNLFLDQINCRPEEILAVAKPVLKGNLSATEENIFRATVHFNRYLKNVCHFAGLLEETMQEYGNGFEQELDIRKDPLFTDLVKRGSLKRLENLRKALVDLNLDTNWICSPESLEKAVRIIDEAYKFKSEARGQLYYPRDLEAALV